MKRTLLVPELEVLDFPDTNGTCEQRVVSTVAPQALTWLNGAFIREQARQFAARLAREAGDDSQARVELAYRLALARPVTAAERDTVLAFLERHEKQIASRCRGGEPASRCAATSLGGVLPGAAQRQRVCVSEIRRVVGGRQQAVISSE